MGIQHKVRTAVLNDECFSELSVSVSSVHNLTVHVLL